MKYIPSALFQIADGIGDILHLLINEGKLVFTINIHQDGVAVGIGEIALLIVCIELVAGLGGKGFGGTGQGRADGVVGNQGAVCKRIVNGILHSCFRTPLGKDVQVTIDRHIVEVEGFFLRAVHIEPAGEHIVAIGWLLGRLAKAAVRDGLGVTYLLGHVYGFENTDRVGLGSPLGVEGYIGSGHGLRSKVNLGTLKALGRGVPASKLVTVGLHVVGVIRCEVVAVQWRFVLNTGLLVINKCIIVVEF